MEYQTILMTDRDAVRTITVNREKKMNALDAVTIREIGEAVRRTIEDPSIRVVILTGAGEKAFVAGADISELADLDPAQGEQLAREGQELVFDAIHNSPKPFIAAINGFALGGGLELALACHIRIAAHQAKMGMPETSLGLIPGYGGTQRLTQLVGRGKAMEMILTGDMLNAQAALQCGLVNATVEPSLLLDTARRMAAKIAIRSRSAISSSIKAINASTQADDKGYETEIKAFGACFGTGDFKEGVSAFLEKRKPSF